VLYAYLLGLTLAVFRVWPGASIMLPALDARPELRAMVCRLHSWIQTLLLVPRSVDIYTAAHGGGPGDGADTCPPSAPALVVFWMQLVGLLAPLAAAFMIELRAKGAFLRARGLQQPIAPHNIALGMAAVLVTVTHVVWFTGGRLV
jgi:hypothetical protein